MFLETIGTVISIGQGLKSAKDAKDGYEFVSGLLFGKKRSVMEQQLAKIESQIEKISDHIWVATDYQAVRDISRSRQQQVDDKRVILASLDPVQRTLNTDILSSAVILSPEKMQRKMIKDPFDLFIYYKPISLAVAHPDPSLTPVLFHWEGQRFIGWQKREMLGVVFDCELNELWLASEQYIQTNVDVGNITQLGEKLDEKSMNNLSDRERQKLEQQLREDPIIKRLLNNANWKGAAEAAINYFSRGEECMIPSWRKSSTWKQVQTVYEGLKK